MSSAALKVGLLHYTAPPIVGGVEAIVSRQARALTARGHDVRVLAGRGGPMRDGGSLTLIPELDSRYPPLVKLNAELRRGSVPPDFMSLSAEVEALLRPHLERLDVCVVHNAHTLHFNLPLTAALHRLAFHPPCGWVAWCHDLSWTNPLYRDVVHPGYPWVLLKMPLPNTRYVVVSEDRRLDLAGLTGVPHTDLSVVPAGVDLSQKWALGRSTRRLLDEFDLGVADPFMLLPVRITPRKNIEYAIRVVAGLRALGRSPKMLVTGPLGPHDSANAVYARELQAVRSSLGLDDEVILLQADRRSPRRATRPTDPMMDELYRAADLMLLPSAQEGFGIPLLEAGAVALPIFCSDIPPFRELAGDIAEFFALDEPPEQVAARIADFLSRDGRYRLRKRVVREFDWDAIVDERLLPLLREAASGVSLAGVQ